MGWEKLKFNSGWQLMMLLFNLVMVVQGNSCPSTCFCRLTNPNTVCVGASLDQIPRDIAFNTEFFSTSKSNLTVLRNNTFADMNMLNARVIFLQNTGIQEIEPSAFRGLEGLTTISLIANSITHLHPDSLPSNLQILYLSENPLIVPRTGPFLSIPTLETLHLSKCNITEIPDHMFIAMKLLSRLKLNQNLFNKIGPKIFNGLRKLRYVDLSYNRLEVIHVDTFKNNWELDKLRLDGNRLRIHSDAPILDSPYLKILKMSFSDIPSLNEHSFKKVHNLQQLVIRNCSLKKIERNTFQYLRQLHYLDLSYNKLTHFHPDLFRMNFNLKTMIINNNYLDVSNNIPFLSVPKLEELKMKSCNVVEIPLDSFQDMLALKTIDLSNNQIEELDEAVFDNLSRLSTVQLSGNPLACKCSRKQLTNWGLKYYVRMLTTCLVDGHVKPIRC